MLYRTLFYEKLQECRKFESNLTYLGFKGRKETLELPNSGRNQWYCRL